MPVNNATFHASVGMFYALKTLFKSKSEIFQNFFTFILFGITLVHLNNVHLFFQLHTN